MWTPRGIPLLCTGSPPGRHTQGCTTFRAQFPQVNSSSRADLPGCAERVVDSSRSPCQVLEESSSCPRFRSDVGSMARNGGPTRGWLEEQCGVAGQLHSHALFILEPPRRHPHAAAPSDLGEWPKSTELTGPTTTSVLHLEKVLLKQGVWKLGLGAHGSTAAPPQPDREARRRRETDPYSSNGSPDGPEGRRRHVGTARVRFGVGPVCETADYRSEDPNDRQWRGQTGRWSLQA